MPGRGRIKAGVGVAYVRSSKAPGQAACGRESGREGGKGFLSFRREDCAV